MGGDFLFKKFLCIILIVLNLGVKAKALDISARSAILYEPVTRTVVFEKNSETKLPMASTTKIITAITAIENMNLKDIVTTSKKAADVEGSSIWLEEGEKQTLENLLFGLMLSSGNDAAIAIAEHKGYDEFIKLMNETAKKAGAENTYLKNPNGLDEEGHYTTAYDMALISAYAMKNHKFREIVSTKEKVIPWENHQWGRTLKNHNKLLRLYEGANGIKTGFTKKDGRCLVSSAERNGVKLICVTLNAPNDWDDHTKMLDMGFSLLESKEIILENKLVNIVNGEKTNTTVKSEKKVSVPAKSKDVIEVRYNIKQSVNAPVDVGDIVGKAEIYLNGNVIETVNYIAAEKVDEVKTKAMKDCFLKMICALLN